MDGNNRKNITKGSLVDVVQKPDQRTGNLTRGKVKLQYHSLPLIFFIPFDL
jgi:uncharacterized repeat protein (TIGR03833 family)